MRTVSATVPLIKFLTWFILKNGTQRLYIYVINMIPSRNIVHFVIHYTVALEEVPKFVLVTRFDKVAANTLWKFSMIYFIL